MTQDTLILITGTIVLLVLCYFVVNAAITLLRKLVDHGKGSLKGIFVLLGAVMVIWVLSNQERSPEILQEIQEWAADYDDSVLPYFSIE